MNGTTIARSSLRPADLVITAALLQRPERAPDLRAEEAAFFELSQILPVDLHRALRRFTEIALRLCCAGSAGLSLLQSNSSGHSDFEWEAVSGGLAPHEGDGTPRNFSPCGLCLDAGAAILLSRPELKFTYLARVQPSIFETLIVPLYDDGHRPLGALWSVHHDPVARFGVNDLRIMEQLATQMAPALKLMRKPERFE